MHNKRMKVKLFTDPMTYECQAHYQAILSFRQQVQRLVRSKSKTGPEFGIWTHCSNCNFFHFLNVKVNIDLYVQEMYKLKSVHLCTYWIRQILWVSNESFEKNLILILILMTISRPFQDLPILTSMIVLRQFETCRNRDILTLVGYNTPRMTSFGTALTHGYEINMKGKKAFSMQPHSLQQRYTTVQECLHSGNARVGYCRATEPYTSANTYTYIYIYICTHI